MLWGWLRVCLLTENGEENEEFRWGAFKYLIYALPLLGLAESIRYLYCK